MTYSPRPNPQGDTLVLSRDPIRTNFEVIQTRWETNHQGINVGGKHIFVQMPQVTAAPTTAVNEGAVYTKDVSGVTQLFYRTENNGAEIQLTQAQFGGSSLVNAGGVFNAFGVANGNVTGADLPYSYNLQNPTGIVKTGTGAYTVNFQTPLPSANYVVNFNFVDDSGTNQKDLHVGKVVTGTRTANGFDLETRRSGNQASDDPIQVMFVCIGG